MSLFASRMFPSIHQSQLAQLSTLSSNDDSGNTLVKDCWCFACQTSNFSLYSITRAPFKMQLFPIIFSVLKRVTILIWLKYGTTCIQRYVRDSTQSKKVNGSNWKNTNCHQLVFDQLEFRHQLRAHQLYPIGRPVYVQLANHLGSTGGQLVFQLHLTGRNWIQMVRNWSTYWTHMVNQL